MQTDWFVEPEHGYTYQMIGADGDFDAANGVYSGPVGETGVTLEIRQGGPFIDFASPIAQMYQDDDIFMGYADTADVTANFGNLPAVHVFAPLDIGPQILMWDPAVNQFESFEDIRDSGVPVLYFEGGKYMDFLLSEGLLDPAQIDASYDGSPTRFVTEVVVQQGFATNEPYRYANDIQEWLKPVDFILTHDSGFEIYQSAMSVKLDGLETSRDCLAGVVPLMQQALVDYVTDPVPINTRMVEMVTEMATFWTLSEGGTADAVAQMLGLDMVSNVDNDTIGDMDSARIQALIDKINPIFLEQGLEGYVEGLTADQIATNEFLDQTIGLP
ncbi:MAG: ABC transporter substrate-binding protein [Acidimicrobiia bacterium]